MDSVRSHTKTITKSAYYHLKNKSGIKWLMSQQEMEKCVHAFILFSLEYAIKKIHQTAAADSERCC